MPIYINHSCDDDFFPMKHSLRSSIGIGPKVTKTIDAATKDWLDKHPEATTTVEEKSLEERHLKPSFSLELCRCFDTAADMQDVADLKAGMICHTNGFHASDDGGAAYYTISASGTVNGMDVLALQGGLKAVLTITKPYVTPEQFGAVASGKIIISAFERMLSIASCVKFTADYTFDFIDYSTVSSPTRILVSNKDGCVIDGCGHTVLMDGLTKAYLESIDDISSSGRDVFSLFAFHNCSNIAVMNLRVVGTNPTDATNAFRFQSPRSIAVAFKGCNDCIVDNVHGVNVLGNVVNATTDDTLAKGSKGIQVRNCSAENCYENGFNFMGRSENSIMEFCRSIKCGTGFEAYGDTCIISNCFASNCFASGISISGGAKAIGNHIIQTTGNADGNGAGVAITGTISDISKNCEVRNNVIVDCTGFGVYVYPYTENTVIDGNIIENCGITTTYNLFIYFTGSTTNYVKNIIFSNNTFIIKRENQLLASPNYVDGLTMFNCLVLMTSSTTFNYIMNLTSLCVNSRITNNDFPLQIVKGATTGYMIGNNVVGNAIPAIQTDL